MYILVQNGMKIINSDAYGLFSVRQDNDVYDRSGGYVIIACAGQEDKPIRLAKYRERDEAKEVLRDLYIAISSGDAYYEMPEPEDDE